MECHACGLKGHKIKECQTKQSIYIVNLKQTLRSILEIQEEMQQYGNIKSIKVRHDRYGYEINKEITQHKKRQKKQSAKLIKGQNGMLRHIKTDMQNKMRVQNNKNGVSKQ